MKRKRENPSNLNKPGESGTDRSDRGKEIPGYSNQTGDVDRVDNMDTDLDGEVEDVDADKVDGKDPNWVRGNVPGRSDINGDVERGPESGRGNAGKGSEGGEISGL